MTAQRAPRRAVVMALMGRYERLLEQPVARDSDVEFVCFTDDPELRSETWRVEVIEPALPDDLIRSARIIKIRGHELLDGFDETLWIDNTVLLKTDPAALLDRWLDGADLALPSHSFRSTVAAEFDAVLSGGRDDASRVHEQLASYAAHHPQRLEAEALWTALVARRRTPLTARTMAVWLDHVLRYSRRDQLSVTYAIAETGQPVNVVDLDNHESSWHRWPVATGRAPETAPLPARWPAASESERFARLHGRIDELTLQLSRSVAAREALLEEMLASTSWRLTRGVRRAGRLVNPMRRRRERRRDGSTGG